jgi:hypothetical protein
VEAGIFALRLPTAAVFPNSPDGQSGRNFDFWQVSCVPFRAVLSPDSLRATWHVGRSRRNLPPRLEASAGKGPMALGESPRSSFGTREVAKAGEARGRPRLGTDDVDIDILRLVELAGF